jgi:hypothetical protein
MCEINNDADWLRAFAFWLLLVIGTLTFAMSVGYFMLVQYSVREQLYPFCGVLVILLAAVVLGRWNPETLEEEGNIERWRIGPALITILLLLIGFDVAVICGHVWAMITHYHQPPGAF